MREYRKPNCPLRAKLPGLTALIDDILAGASVCDPVEVVKVEFDGDPTFLDHATFKAIEERYSTHQRNTTSDQKMIIMVMDEVCHTDNWM